MGIQFKNFHKLEMLYFTRRVSYGRHVPNGLIIVWVILNYLVIVVAIIYELRVHMQIIWRRRINTVDLIWKCILSQRASNKKSNKAKGPKQEIVWKPISRGTTDRSRSLDSVIETQNVISVIESVRWSSCYNVYTVQSTPKVLFAKEYLFYQ